MEFIRYFWHVLEPVDPFVEGWPLECMCAHLEAITAKQHILIGSNQRQFNRLLANVPPGFMKSLCTNVLWPAWEWGPMGLPHLRYVAFSYSPELTQRDNAKFRDLITSESYRELWGHVFSVVGDGKIRVTNDKTGFKFATSIGGVGTGERGHRILCLPAGEPILTDRGWLSIDTVVNERMDVRVAGMNHATGVSEWQSIEAYEHNPGNEIVEIEVEGGAVRCTRDHPVFVQGLGYARADCVQPGDAVLWCGRSLALPQLQGRDQTQTEPPQEVLQPPVSDRGGEKGSYRAQQSAVHRVPDDGLSPTRPHEAHAERDLLQPRVPREVEPRGEQSGLRRWQGLPDVQALQQAVREKAGRCSTRRVLLDSVRQQVHLGHEAGRRGSREADQVRPLLGDVRPLASGQQVLLSPVRGRGSRPTDGRGGEWPIHPWGGDETVSSWLDADLSEGDPREGRGLLSPVWERAGTDPGTRCAPYQLRQERLVGGQPHHTLPVLPRENARLDAVAGGVEEKVVRSVRIVGAVADTYNVRVGPHHNYYASGVLVHNCDDIHKIKQSESDEAREATTNWVREAMQNRLNDLERDAIVVIMQRVHEADSSGIIAKHLADEYCHLMIPMEFEHGRHFSHYHGWNHGLDPRTKEGELAWEDRYPARVLGSFKRNAYLWAGQYQQSPTPRGGGLFKDDWWQVHEVRRKDGIISFYPEVKPIFVLASLDTAFSEKESADYSALSIWVVYEDPVTKFRKILLADAWQKRLPELSGEQVERKPGESEAAWRRRAQPKWGLVEWVDYSCRRRRANLLIVENKNRAPDAIRTLKKHFGDRDYGVRAVNIQGDKWARAIAHVDLFTDNMVYAPAEISESGEVLFLEHAAEMMRVTSPFPNGQHDDLVDSMTLAFKFLKDNGLAVRKDEARADLEAAMTHKPQKPVLYPV